MALAKPVAPAEYDGNDMNNEQADAQLKIDPKLVTEVLCRFLRTEIGRAGFERTVVGLSGGLDSSVVVALCARALGPENVLAVTMKSLSLCGKSESPSMTALRAST